MPVDPSIALGVQTPQINVLGAMQQGQQMALARQQAQALEEQRQAIAEQRRAQTEKLKSDAERQAYGDAALDELFGSYQPGQPVNTAAVGKLYRAYGPEKGSAIVKGLMDMGNTDLTSGDTLRKSMLTRIAGIRALPPERQEAAYNAVVQDYVGRKILKPEEVAPYAPDVLDRYEQQLLSPDKRYELQHPKPMDVGGRLVVPQADGSVKVVLDKPAEHSAAYKEWQDVNADRAARGLAAVPFEQYQNEDANRKKPTVNLSGMNALYEQSDPKAIAQAIMRGDREPETGNLGRPIGAAVDTELAKAGYNKAAAITDWKATQKHIASMNGPQQLRLNQSINALPELLDTVDALAAKWKGGQFPVLNRANLLAAKNGLYGKDVASVARQLDSQIADVVADLGNVYMGGNSPTDHALDLARKSLSADWDQKVLHDMVGMAKKNVGIRRNSIVNTGVSGASQNNTYAPPPPTPDVIYARDPQGNIHQAKAGTALPAGWQQVQKPGGTP